MGGQAHRVQFRRVGGQQALPLGTVREALALLLRETTAWGISSGKPYSAVLDHYWPMARDEDFVEDDASTATFLFSEFAGTSAVAAIASHHWFSVALALLHERGLDSWLRPTGWELEALPRLAADQVNAALPVPLLVIRAKLCGVLRAAPNATEALVSDAVPPPSFQDLGRTSRRKVETLYASGQCCCALCEQTRSGVFRALDSYFPLSHSLQMRRVNAILHAR